MAKVTTLLKRRLRRSVEENTGLLGQALRTKRLREGKERARSKKQRAPNKTIQRLLVEKQSLTSIETSLIQISKNFELINKSLNVAVTTQEETNNELLKQRPVEPSILARPTLAPTAPQDKELPQQKEEGSIVKSLFSGTLKKMLTLKGAAIAAGAAAVAGGAFFAYKYFTKAKSTPLPTDDQPIPPEPLPPPTPSESTTAPMPGYEQPQPQEPVATPPAPAAGEPRPPRKPPFAGTAAPPPAKEQNIRQNLLDVRRALIARGITDENYIRAVLANVMKETGGLQVSENLDYSKTDTSRIRAIFGSRAAAFSESELDQIKRDPYRMAEMVYGYKTQKGKQLGNDKEGDGWKYRGRGYIGITGKTNYAMASKDLFKDDRLVTDPDLVNDPKIAPAVTAWYMERTRKYMAEKMGYDMKRPLSLEEANRLTTSQIVGRNINEKGTSEFLRGETYTKVSTFSKSDELEAIMRAEGDVIERGAIPVFKKPTMQKNEIDTGAKISQSSTSVAAASQKSPGSKISVVEVNENIQVRKQLGNNRSGQSVVSVGSN